MTVLQICRLADIPFIILLYVLWHFVIVILKYLDFLHQFLLRYINAAVPIIWIDDSAVPPCQSLYSGWLVEKSLLSMTNSKISIDSLLDAALVCDLQQPISSLACDLHLKVRWG